MSAARPTATKIPPSPTARQASVPAPSATPRILSSEELYADAELSGITDSRFASLPVDAALPPLPIAGMQRRFKIVLEDGLAIFGDGYGFDSLRRPVALLLGADAADWSGLAEKLEAAGFMALALETGDLLKARHVRALLQSLLALDSLDAGRIGIVGAGTGADIAFLGCAVNALCDVAALLSPLSRDSLLNMMNSYGARPLWLAAATDDSEAFETALALARESGARSVLHETRSGRGASILEYDPSLADDLVAWLSTHLGGPAVTQTEA